MEALAASFGISVFMLVMFTITISLLFPLLWIWMLVDALLRDSTGYPSRDIGEKVAWIVAMALIQPAAIVYFIVVWRAARTLESAPVSAVTPVASH